MVERAFPAKLIPPGIHDARATALLGAFAAMASEFDFSDLLMRTGDEIADEALDLAFHDFSLTEFIGADGVPVSLARRLIDEAWPLHEQQGTDAGVKLGQSIFGIDVEITHWFEQEPRGHHDTQEVILKIGDADNLPLEPLGLEVQQTALMTIEATKRYSQETALTWRTQARMDIIANALARDYQKTAILPPLVSNLSARLPLTIGAVANAGEIIKVRPKPVTFNQVASPLTFGATVNLGEIATVYPYQPDKIESLAAYDVAAAIVPADVIVTLLPEPDA